MWTEENTVQNSIFAGENVLAGSLSWARFFCCHRRSEIGLLVSTFTESQSRGKKVVVLVQLCCFERALWSWRDSDCPVNWAIRKQVVNNQLSKCKLLYCTTAVWGWVRVKSFFFLKMQLDFELEWENLLRLSYLAFWEATPVRLAALLRHRLKPLGGKKIYLPHNFFFFS